MTKIDLNYPFWSSLRHYENNGVEFYKKPLPGIHYYENKILIKDKVRVTDPCYLPNEKCAYTVDNMRSGKYVASVIFLPKVSGGPSAILIVHEDYQYILTPREFTYVTDNICVDSGQAGLFDLDEFIKANKTTKKHDSFYGKICDITEGKRGEIEGPDYAGIYKNWGFVSLTNSGDGVCNLYKCEDNKKIVSLCIDYIGFMQQISIGLDYLENTILDIFYESDWYWWAKWDERKDSESWYMVYADFEKNKVIIPKGVDFNIPNDEDKIKNVEKFGVFRRIAKICNYDLHN